MREGILGILMALGDLMSARFSHSSPVSLVSTHYHHHYSTLVQSEFSSRTDDEALPPPPSSSSSSSSQRPDSDAASSSGFIIAAANQPTTSFAYLPQTVVLCDLRHQGFEDPLPSCPSHSGLVSKRRPKERV